MAKKNSNKSKFGLTVLAGLAAVGSVIYLMRDKIKESEFFKEKHPLKVLEDKMEDSDTAKGLKEKVTKGKDVACEKLLALKEMAVEKWNAYKESKSESEQTSVPPEDDDEFDDVFQLDNDTTGREYVSLTITGDGEEEPEPESAPTEDEPENTPVDQEQDVDSEEKTETE
ncbi:MAG: hypothetical protein ACI4CT_00820 [Lachnospiraceae bacterium]